MTLVNGTSNKQLQRVVLLLAVGTLFSIFVFLLNPFGKYQLVWKYDDKASEKIANIRIRGKSSTEFSENINSTTDLQFSTVKFTENHHTTTPANKLDYDALEKTALKKLKESTNKKVIIVWYKTGIGGGQPQVNRDECGNCEFTRNRTMISNNATAALVFYYKDISVSTMPPISERNPNHMYVFWNKEPTPLMRYVHRKELDFEENYQFNATMTYRRDSDFYNSYRYHWIRAAIRSRISAQDILKMKNKSSIAILSDCDWTAGARLRYKMLLKIKSTGYPMDGFGKCFHEGGKFPLGDKQLVEKVRNYKFYFAFENSYHCTDYITEKFFRNALYAGAVPVVMGSKKEHYEAISPPGSFIFLEDFKSVEHLIEYLQHLEKNDEEYLAYFRWRMGSENEAMPYDRRKPFFCQLCRTLHGVNVDDVYNPKYNFENPKYPIFTNYTPRRTIKSLKYYLFEDEDPYCMEKNETFLPIYTKYNIT
uniref:alpha-(1,3)-fucosyltransferase fut-5-like n=1 Tax=Styela clava TaxID=7725 RepID=UPI00193ABB7A|nr:alpha-(1,3)-fucosyltransferase fut-5-like [Styela clava]